MTSTAELEEPPLPPPGLYGLHNDYPYPFATQTVLSYGLPEAEYVRIVIYEMIGRRVSIPVDGFQSSGHRLT